jgi:sugar lactone lactonase YvrE
MDRRRFGRGVVRICAGFVSLLVVLLVVVKLRFGRGSSYRDVSTPPIAEGDAQSVLVELDFPPGNVTNAPDGRIFFNTHPFTQSHRFTDSFLFELVDGKPRPYPDAASQSDTKFVFGMTVDAHDRLWVVSPATLDREKTRIQAYDLRANRRVIDHELAPGVGRFAQDLRVARDGKTLFLADTGAFRFTHASILVVDVDRWTVREVLGHDPSTQPQDWIIQTFRGPHRVGFGLLTFQVGVDGIALSRDGDWLYYATMSHDTLYRVQTAAVLDASLSEPELARRVEAVGTKPLSDGIEVAADGSVIITDVEHGGLMRLKDGRLDTLSRDPRIVWADGVTITASGDALFTDSSIPTYIDQLLRLPAAERLKGGRPYRVYRLHLPKAIAGR